jgi:cytochrome c oxidase subunit 2
LPPIIKIKFNRFFLEAQTIELFWTTLPAFILIFIAIPSLKTLYLMEENLNPLLTIKTIGYQ